MTGALQSVITIVLFLFILGTLVVIHELGHFITARLAGVRVLEFGIGFPPRAKVIGRGRVHPIDAKTYAQALESAKAQFATDPATYEALVEIGPPRTTYTLNWLPIGGFVKLDGEDGDSADDPRSFSAQRLPVKLGILVAGVVMNVLLAFVIFTGIALGGDPTLGVTVGHVQPDSPAAAAGLEAGDTIVTIDGVYYGAFGDKTILAALAANAGQTVELGVVPPDGSTSTITVTLRDAAAVAGEQGCSRRLPAQPGRDRAPRSTTRSPRRSRSAPSGRATRSG